MQLSFAVVLSSILIYLIWLIFNYFKSMTSIRPGEPTGDNLTRQQLKKIQKSMKRPQFMGLLNEYMVEISDPKNKSEYDQYLRQMQREKQLPKHMKLAQLTPVFCFRTFIVSQKNKKHQMKFFINMCSTQYLEKPSCEPTPGQDGKGGFSWKIPNSSGKIRYDQDKKGNPCQVVEVAFHPDTFLFARQKAFHEMIISIALEASEKQLGERKETLSRDYIVLKNVICKSQDGKPALMPIRYIQGKIYNKGEGPTDQPERDREGNQTKLQKEINKAKEEHQKEKKEKEGKKQQKEQEQEVDETQQGPKKKLIVDMQQGVQRPKYSVIYTYPVDYSQFVNDGQGFGGAKKPSLFNIQLAIPRVQSMEQVAGQKLQINDKQIVLKIGQKYFIDLQFEELKVKYPLLTASAKAKYDKKKKVLKITIPIDPSYVPPATAQPNQAAANEDKPTMIENQVWKNQVLDFSQPAVSVKVLQQKQPQQAQTAPLIEEIQEQDQIESKVQPQQQQIQQKPAKKAEKFSVSNYYRKPNEPAQVSVEKVVQSTNQHKLSYIFQETADKLVIVIQMKNYNKDDVTTLVQGTTYQMFIEWNNAGQQHYLHLKIKDPQAQEVAGVQVVQRVGFVSFMISKSVQEKGKYWQKGVVQQFNQETYEIFKNRLVQLQTQQMQAMNQQEKAKNEQQQINNQKLQENSKNQPALAKQISKPVQPTKKDIQNLQDPQDQATATHFITQSKSDSREPAQYFGTVDASRAGFQFILFNAPFIDNLD